jgi:hypothetical protein
MAILVSLIGLSAVAVGRINLRAAAGIGDASSADLLALSAVEHAVAVVNSQPGWRSNSAYWNGQFIPPVEMGAGMFSWKLVDEADADVRQTVGGIQPVRVYGMGQVGDARRVYSVMLVPTGTNLLANSGMEAGVNPFEPESGNCVLESSTVSPRSGSRSLSVRSRLGKTAGPRQEVTGKLASGKSYFLDEWVKMSSTTEVPKITLEVQGNGGLLGLGSWTATYTGVPKHSAGLDWTRVSVAVNTNWEGGTPDKAWWKIETSSTNQDFWVDDVKVIESTTSVTAMPMAPARETWRQEGSE